MEIEFNGTIWFWRGPAPWFSVAVPAEEGYGRGVILVHVRIGKTEWKTSLFPKNDYYLVPIRASVRKADQLEGGGQVTVRLEVR